MEVIMDTLELWKRETICFLSEIEDRVGEFGKTSDKDKKIMRYLFNQYLIKNANRDYQKAEIAHELFDVYSYHGMRRLKKEIRQSIEMFNVA
jgi:hypothetical protein